ncbi:NAD-dependent epimerase/dehydratase family protein [Winogradskyella sp. PE311]|uniref:NAD-dependent epimerase/dehydratase family protein n=1 Tax=Winogradskyella sp. PE311 TaxID=3366943 RepID=UPI00397EECA0
MKTKNTRRAFIKKSALAGMAIPILGSSLIACKSKNEKEILDASFNKLKILILGGTSFLGPHQIAYALKRGHSVTTFTRGKTLPSVHAELFDQVEQLIGDREDNLKALENRKWDVVIDNSGHKSEWTKATANLLKDNADIYMYTSSTGVYYPYLTDNIKEDKKLVLSMPEGLTEDEQYEQKYGVMKGNSELEAIKAFGDKRTIIVRPTYMIGPADKTDRFIHWPIRLSKGGEVLVPGTPEDLVQYIDVRDVAEWFIRLAENNQYGTYNAVGPKEKQNMNGFITEAEKTFNIEHNFVWIDNYDFLVENKVYFSVPWIPSFGKNYGTARVSNSKAINSGLTLRPIKETVKDTYDWWTSESISDERRSKYETNPDNLIVKEAEMLKIWKSAKFNTKVEKN